MPKPSEVARITVNDVHFEDWLSVWVQHRFADSSAYFRFTAVEREPIPDMWTKLQFKPEDHCTITLGGQPAFTGFIVARQTAYDANNHQVQLSGKSDTWPAATSSVESKTSSFDNMSFEQVARKVLAPHRCGIKVIGKLDPTKFVKLQCQPGELIWDFLERIARPRGVIMGSDHLGNMLLIGEHQNAVVQNLTEGDNILKCQCVISKEHSYGRLRVRAQFIGSNSQWARQASELEATVPGRAKAWPERVKTTVAQQPVQSQAEVQREAQNEYKFSEDTEINATITVQGWLRDGKVLWQAGDVVIVKSPMAMLNHELKIQTVTFTQDSNAGTLTILDLVLPQYLNGGSGRLRQGSADVPGPGGPAVSTADTPPADPPSYDGGDSDRPKITVNPAPKK